VAELLTHRPATLADAALLAEMNRQLIADEGHRNAMTLPELEARVCAWLGGEHAATIFERHGAVVAYALWRDDPDWIYVRQFFVSRACRREGIGTRAVQMLREQVWPRGKRVRVEALIANEDALAFWRSVGFSDYALTLESA
jgi:GNAT superfamily N-acetyltransferase